MARDPYALLGVSPGTDFNVVKKRYRRLAMKYHPDRAGSDAKKRAQFEKKMSAYNTAFAQIQEASSLGPKNQSRGARRPAASAEGTTRGPSSSPFGPYGVFVRSGHLWSRAGINHFRNTRLVTIRNTLFYSFLSARVLVASAAVLLTLRLLTLRDFSPFTSAPDYFTGGPAKLLLRTLTVDAASPSAAATSARAVANCKLSSRPLPADVAEDLGWVRSHWNDRSAIERVILACHPLRLSADSTSLRGLHAHNEGMGGGRAVWSVPPVTASTAAAEAAGVATPAPTSSSATARTEGKVAPKKASFECAADTRARKEAATSAATAAAAAAAAPVGDRADHRFDPWWREALQVVGASTAACMSLSSFTLNPAVRTAAAEVSARGVRFTTRIPMGCADGSHAHAAAAVAASGIVSSTGGKEGVSGVGGGKGKDGAKEAVGGTAARGAGAAGGGAGALGAARSSSQGRSSTARKGGATSSDPSASVQVVAPVLGDGCGVIRASAPVIPPALATRGKGVWATEPVAPLSWAALLGVHSARSPSDAMATAWERVAMAYRRVDGAVERRGDHEHAVALSGAAR